MLMSPMKNRTHNYIMEDRGTGILDGTDDSRS